MMTDEQIKHMANRFLSWRLPDDFCPDAGISFKPSFENEPMRTNHWPVGTNLFTATQAEAMARYLVEGMPTAEAPSLECLLRMTVPVPAGCITPDGTPMSPEFRVSVQHVREDGVHFIIHAHGHSSETLDLVAKGNTITPLSAAASQAVAIAQARAALYDAELARDRSKNAMDAGSFGGRNRTAQAQRTVDQMRANLASLEAAETQP